MTQPMTHSELIAAASKWLRTRRYPIVLCDVQCAVTSEQPDVIGWTNGGLSCVVECKASRSDFQRDARKWFRRSPEVGMGYERWFCAPAGMLTVADLPERWGLVEPSGKRMRVVRKADTNLPRNERCERALLVNALRRATEGWGRRMFGEIAPPLVDGDPHPTASRIIRELRTENTKLRAALRAVPPISDSQTKGTDHG